jgi:hypothetical protein
MSKASYAEQTIQRRPATRAGQDPACAKRMSARVEREALGDGMIAATCPGAAIMAFPRSHDLSTEDTPEAEAEDIAAGRLRR